MAAITMNKETLGIVLNVVEARIARGLKNSNSFKLPEVYLDMVERAIEATEHLGKDPDRVKLLKIWEMYK